MSSLLPFLIIGLTSGSLYGLAGLGLVLTYRTSGVFNFGHGAIAAAAAFLFYTLHFSHGLPWPIAGFITLALFATVGGAFMEWLTRPLTGASPVVVVVATTGIFLAVGGFLFLLYGNATRRFPQFLPESGFTASGVLISWAQVISAAVALGAAVGLYVFLRRSRLGVAMRGVVDNPTLLGLTGGRATRVRRAAWMIGCLYAALSGILLAPTLGLDVILLTLLVVQAFGACAFGRFSSLPLTYLGGLVIGVVASLLTKYLTRDPWFGLIPSVPFLVLVAVLVAVPASKFPRAAANTTSQLTRASDRSARATTGLLALGGPPLLLVPMVTGTDLPVWINACSYVVLFGSLALLVWTSGQISLCHMAFAALGATTLSHLTAAGVPWLPALILAGLAGVPAGALVAIPAIRVSGIYLALATLGFGILMQNLAFPSSPMFGAGLLPVTASRPQLGFIDGASDTTYYYVALSAAAVTCLCLALIRRGRLGQLLAALGTNPSMLSAHGLSVNLTRLTVFCVSAFFAAVAGALMVTQYGSAIGASFGPIQSLVLVAVLAICGTRLLRSPIIAAALVAILPGYVSNFDADRQLLLFGLAAVLAGAMLAARSELTTWLQRVAAESDHRLRYGPVTARVNPHSRNGGVRTTALATTGDLSVAQQATDVPGNGDRDPAYVGRPSRPVTKGKQA